METTNLNIRLDSSLKKEADTLFKELGLNMTTAINIFLTKCVKTASIPFAIEKPKNSKKLQHALDEAEKIVNNPENEGYTDIHQLFEDILNDKI